MNHDPARALGQARWRKSRHSQGQNSCVEVATAAGWIGVRDSKLGPDSPILTFTETEWSAFLAGAKDHEFDL